jgi:hypothetical protein
MNAFWLTTAEPPPKKLRGGRRHATTTGMKRIATDFMKWLLNEQAGLPLNERLPIRPDATRKDARGIAAPCETIPGRTLKVLQVWGLLPRDLRLKEKTLYEWYLEEKNTDR